MKTRVRVLGGLQVVRGRQTVARFRTRQAAGLLCYLACHRARPTSRDVLLELLWPGEDPSLTRQRLSQAISALRRILEPDRKSRGTQILADRESLQLSPSVESDLETLERALDAAEAPTDRLTRRLRWEEAVGNYKGPLLPERTDEWILVRRASIESRMKSGFGSLRDAAAEDGDLQHALVLARAGAALDALDEEMHAALLGILVRSGKRAEAVRVYRAFAERLHLELGLSPDEETAALVSGPDAAMAPRREREEPRRVAVDLSEGATLTLLAVRLRGDSAARELGKVLRPGGRGVLAQRLAEDRILLGFPRVSEAIQALSLLRNAAKPRGRGASSSSVVSGLVEVRMENGRFVGEGVEELLGVLDQIEPGWTVVTRSLLELWKGDRPGPVEALGRLGCTASTEGRPPHSPEVRSPHSPEVRSPHSPEVRSPHSPEVRSPHSPEVRSSYSPEYFAIPSLSRGATGEAIATRPDARTNVGPARTRFFGRADEISKVSKLVGGNVRLITILGFGGAGKTRLSLEVLRQRGSDLEGGAWFVDLDAISDETQIYLQICSAIGITPRPSADPLDLLERHLDGLQSMLVLDNLEQLLPAAASYVGSLCNRLPHATVLVTSRRPVGIEGEHRIVLAPLPIPDPVTPLDSWRDVPSVRLFVDRAQAQDPDFELTARNAASVADLVSHLEGLPLALELAAARISSSSPAEIARRFQKRTELADRHEERPERHRRMSGVIDWSYRLLDRRSQEVFRTLSAFRGSFDLPAVEAVVGDLLAGDSLAELVDSSLLSVTYEDVPRFRLLESVREFATDCETKARANRHRERHAAHYLQLARSLCPGLVTGDAARTVETLDLDTANFRAAVDHWISQARISRSRKARNVALSLAVEMVDLLAEYWAIRGRSTEGLALLDPLLREAEGPGEEWRSQALFHAGCFAVHAARFGDAERFLSEASNRFERFGSREYLARCLKARGVLAFDRGAFEDAEGYHRASLGINEELGDRRAMAQSIQNLGNVLSARGQLEEARAHFERSLELKRSVGSKRDLVSTLMGLGNLAEILADYEAAIRYHRECLSLSRGIRDERSTAMSLANLGSATARSGDRETGVDHLIEAARLHAQIGGEMFFARSLLMIGLLPGVEVHSEWTTPILAAGRSIMESLGVSLPEDIVAEIEEKEAALQRLLGHARFLSLSAEGASMASSVDELTEHLGRPR